MTVIVEGDGLGDVLIPVRIIFVIVFHDQFHLAFRNKVSIGELHAVYFASSRKIKVAVIYSHAGAIISLVVIVAEHFSCFRMTVVVFIAKRKYSFGCRASQLNIHVAVSVYRDVPRAAGRICYHNSAEAVGKREASVAGITGGKTFVVLTLRK